MTAHLAAGFANYEERNRDYHTISHGLRFQRNRSIDDHEGIIWLGDFNYRIGLNSDSVRKLVKSGDLGTLYENDQVSTIAKIFSLALDIDQVQVELTNGRWAYISLLFRVKDYIQANIQIRQRHR